MKTGFFIYRGNTHQAFNWSAEECCATRGRSKLPPETGRPAKHPIATRSKPKHGSTIGSEVPTATPDWRLSTDGWAERLEHPTRAGTCTTEHWRGGAARTFTAVSPPRRTLNLARGHVASASGVRSDLAS